MDLPRRGPVDQRDLAAEHLGRGSRTVRRRLADLVVEEVDRAITRGRSTQGAVGFADGSPG